MVKLILETLKDNSRLLGIFLSLCAADLILTSVELHYGLIVEANPVMNFLAKKGVVFFASGKLLLTSLCAAIFYKHLDHKLTRAGLQFSTACYAAVLVVHILGLVNEIT